MKLRTWLALLVGILAMAGVSGCVTHMSGTLDSSYEILVLHTNDTHSYVAGMDKHHSACTDPVSPTCVGGTARLAAAIQDARTNDALVLDAGDQFQGTLFYTVNKWPMLADLSSRVGYDAITPGNHEFDEGCGPLADFYRTLNLSVLAANLETGSSCPLRNVPQLKPYVIRVVRGQKVGIVGLVTPDIPFIAFPCKDMKFTDPAVALRRAVADLEKQGVRHVIALTHMGLSADKELARSVDGVDIIVGGHSHSLLASGPDAASVAEGAEGPYPVVEKSPSGQPVVIVTAKYGTEYLGDLLVNFDKAGVPVSWSGSAKRMEASVTPDPVIAARVKEYAAKLEAFRSVKLGEHHLEYADGMDACRSGDCLAGMLQTDAMLEYGRPYGAVAALSNGGSLRAPLKPGEITQGNVLEVMPFGSAFLIREYSGADLLAALEFSSDVQDGHGARLLQPAGLRYFFDPSRPVGQRLVKAELVDEKGKAHPIQPNGHYRVVLSDFLAHGGDGYEMLAKGTAVTAPDSMDADVFSAYVRARTPLPMPKDGRVVNVNK